MYNANEWRPLSCSGYFFPIIWWTIIFYLLPYSSTQISHAVGAAYSLKMDQVNACTITYFGDGGTSTV